MAQVNPNPAGSSQAGALRRFGAHSGVGKLGFSATAPNGNAFMELSEEQREEVNEAVRFLTSGATLLTQTVCALRSG
jgi:hypothetical protein